MNIIIQLNYIYKMIIIDNRMSYTLKKIQGSLIQK